MQLHLLSAIDQTDLNGFCLRVWTQLTYLLSLLSTSSVFPLDFAISRIVLFRPVSKTPRGGNNLGVTLVLRCFSVFSYSKVSREVKWCYIIPFVEKGDCCSLFLSSSGGKVRRDDGGRGRETSRRESGRPLPQSRSAVRAGPTDDSHAAWRWSGFWIEMRKVMKPIPVSFPHLINVYSHACNFGVGFHYYFFAAVACCTVNCYMLL